VRRLSLRDSSVSGEERIASMAKKMQGAKRLRHRPGVTLIFLQEGVIQMRKCYFKREKGMQQKT
jgi:hypothetical protein